MISRHQAATAALFGIAAAALAASTVAAPAHADTSYNLPSETQRTTMGDGTVVIFKRIRERAVVNPSMASTPLHRNAFVSGKFAVALSEKASKIEIRPGYIVGCQVNIGGFSANGGGGFIGLNPGDAAPDSLDIAKVGGTLSLGPGQAVAYYLVDAEKADDFGNEKHEKKIAYKKTDHGALSYANSQLSLRGCGGYAQARSFATILVETKKATQYMSFYGRPFSLG